MNGGLELIGTNVGISFPNILLLIVVVGGIILYAKDFKIGLLFHNFAFAILIMIFYACEWDFTKPLYCFFITLIIMSFTLYGAKTSGGGFVG